MTTESSRAPSKEQLSTIATLRLLENQRPLFLDEDQGDKKLPSYLRAAGINVRAHREVFKKGEEDEVWVREVAKRGWVIVSSDKGLETNALNRLAVEESGAVVFLLEEKNSRAEFWAAALLVSRTRIYEIVLKHKGPLFATVKRETRTLVVDPRRPDGTSCSFDQTWPTIPPKSIEATQEKLPLVKPEPATGS